MIPVLAFFNNRSGVGTTTLVYHVAWKLADLGVRVLAADLDPQANLTGAFLDEDQLEDNSTGIFRRLKPLMDETGDISEAEGFCVDTRLTLIAGDMALSSLEDEFSAQWSNCLYGLEQAFRVTSAFWRILQNSAAQADAQIILMDLGPGLGAINRAALIAADFVVVPMAPDLPSLQGLRSLGPSLSRWRSSWKSRLKKNLEPSSLLPQGEMLPVGYVVLQHAVRLDRPVQAYGKWMEQIPIEYAKAMVEPAVKPEIARLKNFRSLQPMAQEARKPIFHLKPADGAMGAHLTAAHAAGREFELLARELMARTGLAI